MSIPVGPHRRQRRIPAGWFGHYSHGDDAWSACVVHDVSVGGAGIEVRDGRVSVGDRIRLDLQAPQTGVASWVVVGEVRYVNPLPEGSSRVGLKFIGMYPAQRSVLELLVMLQSAETTT